MKRRLRNLSKGKRAAALILVCLLVFGGYFGYHKFAVHADSKPNKSVVNTLADYNAMCDSGKVNPGQEAGDKDNPFLILEIVPYYGQAEVGYLIDGCEPLDFSGLSSSSTSAYSASNDFTRTVATAVFDDEYQRDLRSYENGEDLTYTQWVSDEGWTNEKNKEIETHGYYERVADGTGNFVIDGYVKDESGLIKAKNDKGQKVPGYRPVFKKVEEGKGNFNWSTLYYAEHGAYTLTQDKFDAYAKQQNKAVAEDPSVTGIGITYQLGEREYTTRKDTNYWGFKDGNGNVGGEIWDGLGDLKWIKGHAVNLNDFIRTSLDLDDKSESAIRKMKIAVKTVEPQELAQNPEWVDYADLIYIHESQSVNAYSAWWATKRNEKGIEVRVRNDNSYYKEKEASITKQDDMGISFCGDQDFGWNIAKKLFFKINQLEDYDGSKTYGFAPLLCDVNFMDHMNDMSEKYQGKKMKQITNQHLDYTTMEAGGTVFGQGSTMGSTGGKGANSGLYKFLVMNFLMDQDNFYNYFFKTERDAGGSVITEDKDKNTSYCSSQVTSEDAKEYWNPDTFLPLCDKNAWTVSDELRDRYKINHSDLFYGVRPSLHGATFFYNGGTTLSQGYNNESIGKSETTKDAFDWWKDEYGEDVDSLNPAQMVHYLLQYKRHGSDDDDVGTRDKNTMHVLEIEPCADYIMSEKYLTGAYLPASRFKGKIEVDHMTTAEFNGLKKDINGYYDLIYVGDTIGKFNTKKDGDSAKTVYNDSSLNGYVYLHVGDQADGDGKLRSSGDDISKVKKEQLLTYAKGGNALVLADTLATFKKNSNGNKNSAYDDVYLKMVDPSSNMHALLKALKPDDSVEGAGAVKFKKNNVCALSNLSTKFLSKNCLKYMNKGYTLPKRAKTGMTSKVYKEFTALYKKYAGLYSEITSTPLRWYDADPGLDDDGEEINSSVSAKQTLPGSELEFKFRIGDPSGEYGARIYIDLNGDGVISEDELVKDTFANNSGSKYTFSGEEAKDASGKVYQDKTGASILIPGEQSCKYDFSKNRRFYLNKNKKSGAITWKFVLYNVSTKENYQSVTGTSRYSRDNNGSTDTTKNENKTLIKAYQIVADDKLDTNVNLEKQLQDGGTFKEYTKDLIDFDVSVKTVNLTEFVSEIAAGNLGTASSGEDYNCYIVSCGSEIFGDKAYEQAESYLTTRAKGGVAVIFTGEAIDNKTKSSDAKDILNMSRFTQQLGLYGDIKDKATAPSKDYNDPSKMEYTYTKVMEQGSSGKKKVFNDSFWKKEYGSSAGKTTQVCRNNKGRYTTYPYNISKTFTAAKVSAQDYQLNMDNDSLAVWYSLGPDNEGDDTEYGISPRDASNNYYLYSVENVIYDLIDLEKATDSWEMKLFVNTLSGSVVSPLVTIDSGISVDSGYKNFEIHEVSEKYFNADEVKKSDDGSDMTVYQGVLEAVDSKYSDYKKNARLVDGSGKTGGKIDDTDPTPVPATPTPAPEKKPKQLASGGVKNYETGKDKSSDVFKGWNDSALFVVEYKELSQWHGLNNGDALFEFLDKNSQVLAKAGDISPYLPFDKSALVAKISLGDLKKLYGVAEKDDLDFIKLRIKDYKDWAIDISMIGIFKDEAQYEKYKAGNIDFDDGSDEDNGTDTDLDDSTIEGDESKVGDHDVAATAAEKRSWIPDSATHRIFFTPYTNTIDSKNVNSFKVSTITAGVNDLGTAKEKNTGYINEIYRKVATATGSYVWKFKANKDTHMFTINDNNFLGDKTQYYIYTSESEINNTADNEADSTKWIRFDISNRRKSAITYLHLFYSSYVDKTYVFDLD